MGRHMKSKYSQAIRLALALWLTATADISYATNVAKLTPEQKQTYARPVQIPFPENHPFTLQKMALGKALFFDNRLSGAENMNCSSCHSPSFGWEVPNRTAVGAQGVHLPRQAPTILDVAWKMHFFWDGRADTAEDQAKGPIQNPMEMNLPLEDATKRLTAIDGYRTWFDEVFPKIGVTPDTIVEAIATYERTVVASYAPFDRWVDGDENAISESAKRGFTIFTGEGKCSNCHVGWDFTDNSFHDIGTTSVDIGRGKFEPDNIYAQYAFKTPTLRDIAQRAPYMHNGAFPDLRSVVAHYTGSFVDRPSLSPALEHIKLDKQEVDDLIEFLKALTGERKVVTLPVLPN
jgi:cytochrome c peroxidase